MEGFCGILAHPHDPAFLNLMTQYTVTIGHSLYSTLSASQDTAFTLQSTSQDSLFTVQCSTQDTAFTVYRRTNQPTFASVQPRWDPCQHEPLGVFTFSK